MENQYKPIAQHWEMADGAGVKLPSIPTSKNFKPIPLPDWYTSPDWMTEGIEGNTRRSQATKSIIQIFKDRDELGFQKFNSSLEGSPRNNINDRLTDAIEEACDLIQYLVCLQTLIKDRKNND
jgi:hypothetical protein